MPPRCSFLALPPEIRNKIYGHLYHEIHIFSMPPDQHRNSYNTASLLTSKQAYHEAKLYFITASVVFKGHVQGPQPRALPPHALWKLTKLTVHTEVLRPEPDRTATVQYIRDLGIRLHPGVCPKLLDVDLARTWKHDQLGGTRNVEGKHSLGARTLRSAIQSGNFLENHARLNRLER